MTDTDDLRALLAAATPGPWRRTAKARNGWSGVYNGAGPNTGFPVFLTNDIDEENAALIVAAVNALPGLLDRLEALEAVAAAAEAVMGAAQGRKFDLAPHAAMETLRAALRERGS